MTQEEKQLLLQDLCARLPYEVKGHYKYYDFVGGMEQLTSEDDAIITGVETTFGNPIHVDGYYIEVEYVKLYLRPMSSMTEEEADEFEKISNELLENGESTEIWDTVVDWLNAHHFDHRGLIPMGLALEAKEGMYKTE